MNFAEHVHSLGPEATGLMVVFGMLFIGLILGLRWEYMRKLNG